MSATPRWTPCTPPTPRTAPRRPCGPTPGPTPAPPPARSPPCRWLQLPLYLGLIVAQAVYVVHFLLELWHLVEAAAGSQAALQQLTARSGHQTNPGSTLHH